MPMYITLDVPEKFARWATGANRTLEPDESLPSLPSKDNGWSDNLRPPGRIQNWLDNLHYRWQKKTMSHALSNLRQITDLGDDINQSIFHPDFKKFLVVTPSSSGVYFTANGHVWVNNAVIANKQSVGIDRNAYIIGDTSGNIWYNTDADLTAWTQITNATIGGSGAIKRIHTKFPDSDTVMLLKGTAIRIEPTGITGGAWASPTTPPTIQTTPTHGLIYIGNSTWIVYSGSGQAATTPTMELSYDDGDTWAPVTTEPFGTLDKPTCLAYSRDSARLIVAGRTAANATWIRYSDDLGVTWFNSSLDLGGLPGSVLAEITAPEAVYYCGGDSWVIAGSPVDLENGYSGILVSIDNGLTWKLPNTNPNTTGGATRIINAIACGDREILLSGEPNGISFISQAMV